MDPLQFRVRKRSRVNQDFQKVSGEISAVVVAAAEIPDVATAGNGRLFVSFAPDQLAIDIQRIGRFILQHGGYGVGRSSRLGPGVDLAVVHLRRAKSPIDLVLVGAQIHRAPRNGFVPENGRVAA